MWSQVALPYLGFSSVEKLPLPSKFVHHFWIWLCLNSQAMGRMKPYSWPKYLRTDSSLVPNRDLVPLWKFRSQMATVCLSLSPQTCQTSITVAHKSQVTVFKGLSCPRFQSLPHFSCKLFSKSGSQVLKFSIQHLLGIIFLTCLSHFRHTESRLKKKGGFQLYVCLFGLIVLSGSRLEKVTTAGTWGCCSHCIHSPEIEEDQRHCSLSCILFSPESKSRQWCYPFLGWA